MDHQQQPIPSVTWILKHLPTDETLGFGKTDEQGTFQIDFSSLPTLIELELSLKHLAYEDQAVKLHPQQNQYIITLIEKAIRITDVEVGNRPKISQRGDTLRYLLHDFIDTNDRNVGDALKKLPGLSVLASGKVLFNGQAISGMLIDGDDLFGGKYGIGTRAISSTAVLAVEVITNHQPLKVLQGRLASNQVAVNLVIKEKAKLKLNGDMSLGAGIRDQYLAEANTVLFKDDVKMLNVLKGNSIGINLETEQQDLINTFQPENEIGPLLGTGLNKGLNVGSMRSFLNRSGGLFMNQLYNFNKDWQIKINLDGTLQSHTGKHTSRMVLYEGVDSIQLIESLDTRIRPLHTQAAIRATKNAQHLLFDQHLSFKHRSAPVQAGMTTERFIGTQRLQNDYWEIRNALQVIPALSEIKILNLNWDLLASHRPEQLDIRALDDSTSFPLPMDERLWHEIAQRSQTNRLQSHVHGYFLLGKSARNIRLSWGIENSWDELVTHASGRTSEDLLQEGIWPDNRLHFQSHTAKASVVLHHTWKNIEITGTLPLSLQYARFHGPGFITNKNKTYLYLSPSFQTIIPIHEQQQLQFSVNRIRSIGNILDLHASPILKNHQVLEKKTPVLPDRDLWMGELKYTFGNSPLMLFFNLGYYANSISQEGTPVWTIQDGFLTQALVDRKQHVLQHGLKAGVEKFIFPLGGKSTLNLRWNQQHTAMYIQDQYTPVVNNQFELAPQFNAKLNDKWNLQYHGMFRWHHSLQELRGDKKVLPGWFEGTHGGQIRYQASSKYQISLSPSYRGHTSTQLQAQHILFLDISMIYQIPAWKMTLQLDMDNLLDRNYYQRIAQDASFYHASRQQIRGRSMLLKAMFTLN